MANRILNIMILLSKFSLCNVLIFKGCFTFVVALWHFSNYLVLTCLRVQKERKKVPHTQIFFYGNKFCVTHTHTVHTLHIVAIHICDFKHFILQFQTYTNYTLIKPKICVLTPLVSLVSLSIHAVYS